MGAGGFIESVEGNLADANNRCALERTICYSLSQLIDNRVSEGGGVIGGRLAVLTAPVEAEEQFIAGKGGYGARRPQNAPGGLIARGFLG